ncbi:MAG: cation:proton antiporter, partial [Pseudomonadota bacterium]
MTITIFLIIGVVSLAMVAAFATPAARRLGLPLPVLLASIGFAYGLSVSVLGLQPIGIALDSYDAWFVEQLALDSSTLLIVLLPPLLFEMALSVDVRRLIDDAAAVLVMAIVAVVAATFAVGVAVWGASDIGLVACLILGAAVATTDPSAVVSTFREIGAPRRLLIILEGESLLNDAAAIALFTLLATLLRGSQDFGVGGVALSFLYSFAAGSLTGLTLAFVASRIYPFLGGSSVAETTTTLALAYGAYLLAELTVGGSGVVAVVFAALATGSGAFVKMGPGNWARVRTVWDQIGFWANAIILPLAASLVPGLFLDLDAGAVFLVVVIYLCALLARAAILFGVLPILAQLRVSTPLGQRQKLLVLWGGVRGGVTLVLALSMAELSALGDDARTLAALAAGYTLLTLLLNASTLRVATRLLGLSELSPQDIALRERIVAGSIERVRTHVAQLALARQLEPAAIAAVDASLVEREDEVREKAAREGGQEAPFADSLRAGLSIICGREVRLIRRAFEAGAIGPRATTALRIASERIGDATRLGGRKAYETAMLTSIRPDRRYRLAVFLSFYLSWDGPLRR